jgi:hypothetical protein
LCQQIHIGLGLCTTAYCLIGNGVEEGAKFQTFKDSSEIGMKSRLAQTLATLMHPRQPQPFGPSCHADGAQRPKSVCFYESLRGPQCSGSALMSRSTAIADVIGIHPNGLAFTAFRRCDVKTHRSRQLHSRSLSASAFQPRTREVMFSRGLGLLDHASLSHGLRRSGDGAKWKRCTDCQRGDDFYEH